MAEVRDGEGGISRRRLLKTGAVAALTAATLDIGADALFPGVAGGAERARRRPGHSGVEFTWFGTNGWKIEFTANKKTRCVLMDPWFARFDSGFFPRGDPNRRFDPNTPLTPGDPSLIDEHVATEVDHILIGHGHWDHTSDIPAIQQRTNAQVIGSETHAHLMRAAGVPDAKISIVEGGEFMQFDGYTIEVFDSLHSLGLTKKFGVPGHRFADPPRPTKVADLPEGDSLCYEITIEERFRIFLMSTANFKQRAIEGIRPDVALIAAIFRSQIHEYTSRIMASLDHPKIVLPTHWDDFERPFSDGPQDLRSSFGDDGRLDLFVSELNRISPESKVIVLDFFESFSP